MPLANLLTSFAAVEGDSKEELFNKLLILIIALSCCCCGVVWTVMYYFVFGIGMTMILPLLFVVIVGSAIFISHITKNHKWLLFAQLTCITWISAMVQWSIGSMEQSGLVICWSFLGPLGALIFLPFRNAILWMLMFIVIVVISAWFEPVLFGDPLTVSKPIRIMFYVMNIGVSLTVVFAASSWFVRTIQKEKLRSEKLANRVQSLLGQHLSKEVADHLTTENDRISQSKNFEATVMFVDIRDFTVFADSSTPHEVGEFQNSVFSSFINIVRDNNGVVLQALGDGIMAVFGAPVENKTHSQDGVNAGLQMLEIIKDLAFAGEIPETILGIGLHSGKVIAGEVGNETRKFYILSGSNVIIAARIEQLNKKFGSQFLVSKDLFNQIDNEHLKSKNLGEQVLKGISEPIEIYQLA